MTIGEPPAKGTTDVQIEKLQQCYSLSKIKGNLFLFHNLSQLAWRAILDPNKKSISNIR